jgi:hypothetical protein
MIPVVVSSARRDAACRLSDTMLVDSRAARFGNQRSRVWNTAQMPSRLIERHARALIVEALSDTRVVFVMGARQVGKST